jgi:hypothetical protein
MTSEGDLTVEAYSIQEARLALDRLLDPTAPPLDDFDVPEEL